MLSVPSGTYLFCEKWLLSQYKVFSWLILSPSILLYQNWTPELTPKKVNITILLLIITTLRIMPPHHSPESFFKFKCEPEMTNDSCNTLFDTNHFWLRKTLDNLEHAESRQEGKVLENEQLWLLVDENPLLMRQQQYVLITKQIVLKMRKICGGLVCVVMRLHPLQPSECFLMLIQRQTFTDIVFKVCKSFAHMSYFTIPIVIITLQRGEESLLKFQQLHQNTQICCCLS